MSANGQVKTKLGWFVSFGVLIIRFRLTVSFNRRQNIEREISGKQIYQSLNLTERPVH